MTPPTFRLEVSADEIAPGVRIVTILQAYRAPFVGGRAYWGRAAVAHTINGKITNLVNVNGGCVLPSDVAILEAML